MRHPDENAPSLSKGAAIIKTFAERLPEAPGVYRMLGANKDVLYVGKARNLQKRVFSYARPQGSSYRIQHMIALTRDMAFVTTETESAALLLEATLIKELKPRFNIIMRDDKSYPFIFIDRSHDFPRISKFRGARTRKGEYFGPFPNVGAVDEAIKNVRTAFLLRSCSDGFFGARKRPCMEYQIKRCSAPCMGYVSKERYAKDMKDAEDALSGNGGERILTQWRDAMDAASIATEYEKALEYRNRIRAATVLLASRTKDPAGMKDAHVIGYAAESGYGCINVVYYKDGAIVGTAPFFIDVTDDESASAALEEALSRFYAENPPPADIVLPVALPDAGLVDTLSEMRGGKVRALVPQRGEKKAALDKAESDALLALRQYAAQKARQSQLVRQTEELFRLPRPLKRIEIYDNSHISGTSAVGCMVVAGREGFVKNQYRRFTIKDEATVPGDDYAMMREVMRRRFTRLKDDAPAYTPDVWPDLVLIDGGKGQLSAVMQAIGALGHDFNAITFVGVSKGKDRNAGREWFHREGDAPFQLPEGDATLRYLQILRDEAHRYAIGTHRTKRAKSMRQSALEDVPGVGAKRRRALLRFFGSADAVKQAPPDKIALVEGVDATMARRIYEYFRG